MRKSQKGRKITWGSKISKALMGRKLSKEQCQKISIRLKKEWRTTRKDQRTRNYPHQIEKLKQVMTGENNPMWKGNRVGRSAIHSWAHRRIPKPKLCTNCKRRPSLDLANLNNHNYRKRLEDFAWLCRKCHMQLDGRKPPKRKPAHNIKVEAPIKTQL